MGDPLNISRLLHWVLYAVMTVGFLLIKTLPLEVGASHWPGPELVLVFAMAWVLRRPDFLPIWLVVPILLLADFVLMRPPGLWAAFSILAIEFLRSRTAAAREWPFTLEWGITTAILTLMVLGNRLILAIFSVPQVPLGLDLQQLLSSAAAYPVVVFLSVRFLRLRRPLTTEASLA